MTMEKQQNSKISWQDVLALGTNVIASPGKNNHNKQLVQDLLFFLN